MRPRSRFCFVNSRTISTISICARICFLILKTEVGVDKAIFLERHLKRYQEINDLWDFSQLLKYRCHQGLFGSVVENANPSETSKLPPASNKTCQQLPLCMWIWTSISYRPSSSRESTMEIRQSFLSLDNNPYIIEYFRLPHQLPVTTKKKDRVAKLSRT